jgi:hypothetical protein
MNSFFAVFMSLVLFLFAAPAAGNKTDDDFKPKKERGDLAERIERVAKNQLARDSDAFRPPTEKQQEMWRRAIENILNNRLKEANNDLQKLPYTFDLILFTDETTRREYVLLHEKPPIQTGWGLYVFDLNSRNQLIIEVPHPVADLRTEIEGIDAFLQARAAVFLMAGAHRRANKKETDCSKPDSGDKDAEDAVTYPESDVAHSVSTIFQTTHETIVMIRPKTVAVQLHGMATREICPNVFISSGTKRVTTNSTKLLDCLKKQKVEAGIYSGEIEGCPLAASTNVQGRFSNGEKNPCQNAVKTAPDPGFFIHIEQESVVRRNKESWQPVIEALICAFP